MLARAGHPAIHGELDLATYLAQSHVLVSSRRKGMGLEDFELNRESQRRHRPALPALFRRLPGPAETDLLLTMPESNTHGLPTRSSATSSTPFRCKPSRWMRTCTGMPAPTPIANRWLREQLINLSAQSVG